MQEIVRENIRYKQEYYRYKEYAEKLLKMIANLKQTIVDQQQQIAKLNQQIDHKQAQIAALNRELEQREKVVSIRRTLRPTPTAQPSARSSTPKLITTSSSFSCFPKKRCTEISSCEEAYYHFRTCGNTSLDKDDDGIPCETLCSSMASRPSVLTSSPKATLIPLSTVTPTPLSTATPTIIAAEIPQTIPIATDTKTFCAHLQDRADSIWGEMTNNKQPRIISFDCVSQYLDADHEVYLLNIAYRADENLTTNMTRKGILADASVLIQAFSIYPQIRQYLLRPHLMLIDKYGNESEEQVAKIVLNQDIVSRINWENTYGEQFETILKTDGQLWIHPALQQ